MATDNTNSNPWLGLRTYTEGEVIYGRSEEIIALSGLVLRNTQTVVYGRSGIGKSSILNAGVFPIARRHGVLPVYIRLEHNAPASYLEQIKAAVNREFDKLVSAGKATVAELESAGEDETLWEYFHRMDFRTADGQVIKPLVVFDQFEEIFTLEGSREKRDRFFRELADLINNVMPEELAEKPETQAAQEEQNTEGEMLDLGLGFLSDSGSRYKSTSDFHLIFTLREDFLSYLERNTTDIPELKNNRYCLQPINEEQAAEIIMQPRKGLVSKDVARLIISHVTGEDDFLLDGIPEIQVDSAILSLYLSRLYDKMTADGQSVINAELVEAYSDNIIEDFYTDAIRGLGRESVEWMEDTLVNEDGRRDNRDRLTVMREGKLSDAELKRLTDSVKLLRQFSYGGDLRVEYIHDVLCPVIVKRRNKRQEEQRIAELSEAALREKRRARKNVLIVSMIAVGVAAAAIGAYLWNQYQYVWEVEEAYPHYETRYGWPVGIGPQLNKEEMSRTPRYYVLSKKGHKAANFTTVTVAGSNAVNTEEPAATPFELTEFFYPSSQKYLIDTLLSQTRKIEFISSLTGEVDYISFLDGDSKPQFFAKHYSAADENWYNFVKNDGSPLNVRPSGLDRVKITNNPKGYISSINYYNANGVKCSIDKDIYSYLKTIAPDTGTRYYLALDQFSIELKNGPYNCINIAEGSMGASGKSYLSFSAPSPATYTDTTDIYGVKRDVIKTDGRYLYDINDSLIARMQYLRDNAGNILECAFTSGHGKDFNMPEKSVYTYDESGRLLTMREYDANGKVAGKYSRSFDEDGNKNYEEIIRGEERVAYFKHTKTPGHTQIDRMDSNTPMYSEVTKVLDDNTISICYYDASGRPINKKYRGKTIHKREILESDARRETRYYAVNGGRIEPLDSGYFKVVEIYEGPHRLKAYRTFDARNNILKSMIYFYQNGSMIGRAAMGISGQAVRCPEWEEDNFSYYKLYFNTDNSDNYVSFRPVNEAEIVSSLKWDTYDSYISIDYINFKGNNIDVLEDTGVPSLFKNLPINNDYFQSVALEPDNLSETEMTYLHLLDKDNPLFKAGLKDGDIILEGKKLEGKAKVAYLRYTSGKYEKNIAEFASPLSRSDLEHIHLHSLRLTNEENKFIQQALQK